MLPVTVPPICFAVSSMPSRKNPVAWDGSAAMAAAGADATTIVAMRADAEAMLTRRRLVKVIMDWRSLWIWWDCADCPAAMAQAHPPDDADRGAIDCIQSAMRAVGQAQRAEGSCAALLLAWRSVGREPRPAARL